MTHERHKEYYRNRRTTASIRIAWEGGTTTIPSGLTLRELIEELQREERMWEKYA